MPAIGCTSTLRVGAVFSSDTFIRMNERTARPLTLPHVTAGWQTTSRLRDALVVAAAGYIAYVGGVSLATDHRIAKLLFVAPFLALALVLQPEKLFVGWLFAAPFVQGAANGGNFGHLFFKFLFLVAPLIMLARLGLGSFRTHGFWLIDALPALYLTDILVSARLFPSAYTEPASATTKAIYIAVGVGIVTYYFTAFAKTSGRFPQLVATAFLWSGVVVAALAIIDGLTGWNLWHQLIVNGATRRAVSTFSGPAELGTYLGATMAFSVAILSFGGPRSLRLPSLLLIPLAVPALYYTYTRGPMLAIAAVGVLIALVANRSRWPSLLALAAVGVLVFATWGQFTSSAVYKDRLAVDTVKPRVVLTDVAIDLFRRRPLFGQGYATFDQVKLTLPLPPNDTYIVETTTSHDTFLTVLAESGLVGLVLLVLPWIVIGWRAVIAAWHRVAEPWIMAGCVGATAVYLISALTYDARFFPFISALPWITLGLARKVLGEHAAIAESA